ncbi:hypothetical protein ASG46_06120 [Bacillus sp. Leaf49]|uniref:hypothetical protein n=1 Tax=Bacillus sp. Leaf49 TaxID=1736222 RepID=UPI0006F448EF|nr:hypothetical protein [Bacillus sp. Leaf49]KQU12111.1 hypothetical protein ASG46_06120 [Bacillus sp. Leaf49]
MIIGDKAKHGLSQYRLNQAKNYMKSFSDKIAKIEFMYQLSVEEGIDSEIAENYISNSIKEIEIEWEEFRRYIKQRDDMRELD